MGVGKVGKQVAKHLPGDCPELHVRNCSGCGRSCSCYDDRPMKVFTIRAYDRSVMLPKKILDTLEIENGDRVSVTIKNKRTVIISLWQKRKD